MKTIHQMVKVKKILTFCIDPGFISKLIRLANLGIHISEEKIIERNTVFRLHMWVFLRPFSNFVIKKIHDYLEYESQLYFFLGFTPSLVSIQENNAALRAN